MIKHATKTVMMAAAAAVLIPVVSARAGTEAFVNGGTNDFVANYAGTQDNTFLENNTTTQDNTNGGSLRYLDTKSSSSARYRFILDFNLSALTPYASQVTISNVDLQLTQYNAFAFESDTYNLQVGYFAPQDYGWTQANSTGSYYDSTTTPPTNWKNFNGAAVGPPLNGTPSTSATNAYKELFTQSQTDPNDFNDGNPIGTQYQITDPTGAFLSAVQSWVTTPLQNAGLFFLDNPNTGDPINNVLQYYSDVAANPLADRPTLILTLSSPTMSTDWTADTSDIWSNGSNWDNGVPNTIGATANFGNVTTAQRTITATGPEVVSGLTFSSPYGYTIAGAGPITLLEVNNSLVPVNVTAGNVTISAPVVMNTSTTFNIASGSSLAFTGGLTTGGQTIASAGPGSLLIPAVQLAALNVNAGTVTIAQHSGPSTVAALSIAGGATLDLRDNAINITYTTTSPLATVEGYILSAYDQGKLDLPGLTSSLAATHPGTAIGYTDTGTEVTAMYTWYGDLDLNGTVDGNDLALMGVVPTTGALTGLTGWFDGDLNGDGVINSDDYALFDLGAAESNGTNISSVPEPALFGSIAVGALALNRRRRRS